MIWTLTDGETAFVITDGSSRIYKIAETLATAMAQTTQVAQPMRAEWPIAFPDRATRALSFDIPVMYPACASLEEAAMQALDVQVQCPRGGVLTGQYGSSLRTYSQAWVRGISCENIGLTNRFVFSLSATNPSSSTLSKLAQMDKRYVGSLPEITGLTGGGSSKLDGLVTTDVAAGFTLFITPTIEGIAQPKHFRLMAGTDATQTDPTAGALVVRPADYDGSSNAKVWKEL